MKKMEWGEDPEFHGPRNWMRETLMLWETIKRKENGWVLDYGCGSGNALRRLGKHGFRGLGVDISKSAIKFAESKNKNKKIIFSHLAGDGTFLENYREKFDVIWSGEVLEHIKNDKSTAKSFAKLLKKGGICVISVPAHKYLWGINDDFSSHFRRYERNELVTLFDSVGIRAETVYYWGFPLSLLWDRFIYNNLIKVKVEKEVNYSRSSVLGALIKNEIIIKFASAPFWIDNLFNWTKLGGGLIFVGRKI